MMELSKTAEDRLATAAGSAQGATVRQGPGCEELKAKGLIGFNLGLTRTGSIEKEKRDRKALDAAFGPE